MPNAAAILDADFGGNAPGRRKAARKPRPKAASRQKERFFSLQRVARYGAVAISVTVGVGIVANALLMQRGHHPAPLFAAVPAAKPVPGVAAAEVAPASQEPVAAARVVRPTPDKAARQDKPTRAAPDNAARAPIAAKTAPAAAHADDPIARLLGDAPAASAPKAESRTVMAAQQALGKLGFPVKANGTANVATRKAVEAFEKSRHLPVKGELSRRVLRALATESGIRID